MRVYVKDEEKLEVAQRAFKRFAMESFGSTPIKQRDPSS